MDSLINIVCVASIPERAMLFFARNILAVFVILLSADCLANDARAEGFGNFMPVSDDVLASLRGGFVTSDGVEISIGLEELILINGMLQSRYALDLGGLTKPAPGSNVNHEVSAFMNTFQMGPGNSAPNIANSSGNSAVFNIIQNSLDSQVIHHLTELDITVSNMKRFQAPNLGRLMDFQVTQSLGGVR
jgi:hypothetical protein